MELKTKGKRPTLAIRIHDQPACDVFELLKTEPLQIYEISANLFVGGNLNRCNCCSKLRIFKTETNQHYYKFGLTKSVKQIQR